MFEYHYTELAVAVDEISERIRTLDVAASGKYKSFSALSSIEKVEGAPDDESTAALVSGRMRVHEKTAWMLRATQA